MSLINNRLDHFQEGSFAWFTGVVEDVLDPQELGRVRVRCFGYHTEKRSEIPTNTLPWALVLTPVTNPCMDSIGESATGIIVGTWVVGFFRDGKSAQDPVVIGTLPSKTSNITPDRGFSDPFGNYPKRVNSPDMPLEARSGFEQAGTYSNRIDSRQDSIEMSISPNVSSVDPTSRDEERQTWSSYKQEDVHKTKYPYNKVNRSIGGHLIEMDDTPGYKRLLTQHASGTYQEIVNDGSRSTVVKGNNYTVVFQNDNVYIKGNCNLTVDGDVRTLVKGNYHLEVEGDYTQNIKGNKRTKVGANQYEEIDFHYSRNIGRTHSDRIGTDSTITVDRDMNLTVGNDYNETIGVDYSSKVSNNRTSNTLGNNSDFVKENNEVIITGNNEIKVGKNLQMNSVGSTEFAATQSLTIGTGGPANFNVGGAMVTKIIGLNSLTAPNHIIGGNIQHTGTSILSTGVMKPLDCITMFGISLNGHVHGVPSAGPTTPPR